MTRDDRRPLFARLLRLRHLRLRRWHTALFVDATIALAVVLVLAELATAWTLLVLPLAVALVVKLNDVVAGALRGREVPGDEGGEVDDVDSPRSVEASAPAASTRSGEAPPKPWWSS